MDETGYVDSGRSGGLRCAYGPLTFREPWRDGEGRIVCSAFSGSAFRISGVCFPHF